MNPRGLSAAGRIMAKENSNDTIGNRTRDLPAYSALPQYRGDYCELNGICVHLLVEIVEIKIYGRFVVFL